MSRVVWRAYMNDIGFRFDAEDFCNGLLPPKCHIVVTMDCFHSNMHPCHYVWQPNLTKSSFVWNFIEMKKSKIFLMSRQICCCNRWNATTFVLFMNWTVSSVTRYFGQLWFVDIKSPVTWNTNSGTLFRFACIYNIFHRRWSCFGHGWSLFDPPKFEGQH